VHKSLEEFVKIDEYILESYFFLKGKIMELKLDVKTLIVGILLGVIFTAALGVVGGSADEADFGVAIQKNGYALIRTSNGFLYVVDAEQADAELVENKDNRNRPLNLESGGTLEDRGAYEGRSRSNVRAR
jgi:hypothetical protein